MTPSIALTGIGLVCPTGIGLADSIEGFDRGYIGPTVDRFAQPQAGMPPFRRVPAHFSAKAYIHRRKDLKLMSRANRLAVAAAVLAIRDAHLEDTDLTTAGLCVGVGQEPADLDDILPAAHRSHVNGQFDLTRFVNEGMDYMNPLSSLKTLPNMSLAHVGIRLGIQGPGWTLCSDEMAGLDAIREGIQLMRNGRAPLMIVGAADAKSSFADRLALGRDKSDETAGEGAVFFVLERLDNVHSTHKTAYAVFAPTDPLPSFEERLFGDCGAATLALGYGLSLGRHGRVWALNQAQHQKNSGRAPAIKINRNRHAIAITATGFCTPLGDDLDGFQNALMGGHSAVKAIDAFDATQFPVKNACEATLPSEDALQALDERFAELRRISDRKSELALIAALRAKAAHGDLHEPSVIFGTGLSSVSTRELEEDCFPYFGADGQFDYDALSQTSAHTSGQSPRRHQVDRIVKHLVRGSDAYHATHFSACAAAGAALAHGMERLRRGADKIVLAGGADSMIHPFGLVPFIRLGATSTEPNPRRAGRPFDKDRDGFVMGEGGVFFVLEPAAQARAAGRTILGMLLGWGSSCDAHNVTAPHPQGLGARRAMIDALTDAQLEPSAVDYINAHGTGTPLNDVIEATAIRDVFGTAPAVSSSKGQFGHAIAAAGAMELLACLVSFRSGCLPPNAHLRIPDPAIDLDLVETTGRPQTPSVIVSNSFGFGGQNISLVIGHPEQQW
ncbi:MAG: beta-ketoacyl synthase N-terminal-like domain-containing protein [Myxococcota bacterium]|nr:beta-ketoacyl synthase N-terminal-like domain-containing protein [Myxococcota bacterium]